MDSALATIRCGKVMTMLPLSRMSFLQAPSFECWLYLSFLDTRRSPRPLGHLCAAARVTRHLMTSDHKRIPGSFLRGPGGIKNPSVVSLSRVDGGHARIGIQK